MSDDVPADAGGRWLHSGLRRDICVVVASLDRPTAQSVKAAVERRYDDRIEPRTFYGALDALVDGGHLERETDGIHDRYAPTPAGERLLRAHFAWVDDRLERRPRDGDRDDDGSESVDIDDDGDDDENEDGRADAGGDGR